MSKELDNYVKAFEIAPLTTFYKNSILVAIIATILNLLIFSMAAYVLVRCRFRFKGLITMLFSAALVIPGAALLQPLYQTLNSAHLYDTLTGLIVVYAALGMPTTLYIMIQFLLLWRKLHILMEQDFSEHLYKLFCRLRDRHLRLPGYFSSCFVGMNSSLRWHWLRELKKERFQLRYIISRVRLQVIMELCLQLRCLLQFQVLLFICWCRSK